MRYFIGSEIGYLALPFILVVGAAYMWIADRILRSRADIALVETEPASKVAKAA